MADFHVKIISSNRTFYEGVCHCLILPAVDGEMAVMAHHESEIVAVKAGEMRFQVTEDGPWEAAVVGQGFCEIANNRVMLLADTRNGRWRMRGDGAESRKPERKRERYVYI